MSVIIADRNPKTSTIFKQLFLDCGWNDSIIGVTDAIELIKHFILSKSCTVLLDEGFLGNNTNLLGMHLKEINPKSCLVSISEKTKIGDKIPENFIDYLIIKKDPSKKIRKIVQRIIDDQS